MPDSTPVSPASLPKRPRAYSKGEELYLVHLQRMAAPDPHPEDVEDDHDYATPRKHPRDTTIGEELFQVHLDRSRGLPPDYDVAPEDEETEEDPSPRRVSPGAKAADAAPAAVVEELESESEARRDDTKDRDAKAAE